MSARLAHLWRHPIKGIGFEALTEAAMQVDRPVPGDRAWAMLRTGQDDAGGWQKCTSFLRGANGPSLMAVSATTSGDRLTLNHPERPELTFAPAREGERLAEWVDPIWPEGMPRPAGLVRAPAEGMSDADYPSVSLLSLSSLAALAHALDLSELDMRRFRGNLWIDGWEPWAEFDLIGRRVRLGGAVLEVIERNTRCLATHANPETGERDTKVLNALSDNWGHKDFGVYTRVVQAGDIRIGDTIEVL